MGIKVEKAEGTNSTSVAELTVGMFFVMARNMFMSINSVKNNGWERVIGCEITGKTLGIIGLGHIGREIARICHGIGMNLIAFDPYMKDDEFTKKLNITMMDFDDALKNGDFISLNLPLTAETHHIIDYNKLALMKNTAYLINTSRGELVNENDLFTALKQGVIAGAAEDVFSKEPPGEHRLLTLDNFILTPHIGAFTREATKKMVVKSVQNLIRMVVEN